MKRSFIAVSQELIKERLGLPEDLVIYGADYEPSSNFIRLYFTGPIAQDTPEGWPTPEVDFTSKFS